MIKVIMIPSCCCLFGVGEHFQCLQYKLEGLLVVTMHISSNNLVGFKLAFYIVSVSVCVLHLRSLFCLTLSYKATDIGFANSSLVPRQIQMS